MPITPYIPRTRSNRTDTCNDQVVGAILSGWRYDISNVPKDLRGDYEAHLGDCPFCRKRQRVHRTVDVLLLAVTTLSFAAVSAGCGRGSPAADRGSHEHGSSCAPARCRGHRSTGSHPVPAWRSAWRPWQFCGRGGFHAAVAAGCAGDSGSQPAFGDVPRALCP